MNRNALVQYVNDLLEIKNFKDYCPNGLQVEGKEEITRIVAGVTASQYLIEHAILHQADCVLVHHGYFWKNESPVVSGIHKARLSKLLQHNINLMAYHLPLDAHLTLGNNVQLARVLHFENIQQCPQEPLLFYGTIKKQDIDSFSLFLTKQLKRPPQIVGKGNAQIQRVAWCSGAAQDFLALSYNHADIYLSGEISEKTFHTANELKMFYAAIGHHASERYGVQALLTHLKEKFHLQGIFVDEENPV